MSETQLQISYAPDLELLGEVKENGAMNFKGQIFGCKPTERPRSTK